MLTTVRSRKAFLTILYTEHTPPRTPMLRILPEAAVHASSGRFSVDLCVLFVFARNIYLRGLCRGRQVAGKESQTEVDI